MGGRPTAFKPTGTIADHVYERDPSRRQPFLKRLQHILIDCGAWFHTVIAVALVFAACSLLREASLVKYFSSARQQTVQQHWFHLLRSIAWPTSPWVPTALACLTPLRYAVAPPNSLSHDALMSKRETGGARYPTLEARVGGAWSFLDLHYVPLYTLFMAYVSCLFVWSWRMDA
jgi:hypothetical protein